APGQPARGPGHRGRRPGRRGGDRRPRRRADFPRGEGRLSGAGGRGDAARDPPGPGPRHAPRRGAGGAAARSCRPPVAAAGEGVRRVVAALLAGGALGCAVGPARAQAPAATIHGEDSVFANDDVTMVWAVLRAASEDDTQVVIRVAAPRFAALRVEAVDPFGGGRREVAPRRAGRGRPGVGRRRADFAESPRPEARLEPAEGAREPAPLVVYYLGVPDTTPEFTAEEALQHYLDEALTKARGRR